MQQSTMQTAYDVITAGWRSEDASYREPIKRLSAPAVRRILEDYLRKLATYGFSAEEWLDFTRSVEANERRCGVKLFTFHAMASIVVDWSLLGDTIGLAVAWLIVDHASPTVSDRGIVDLVLEGS